MKVGLADYGYYVWEGGSFDHVERWRKLKEIGYEGVERLCVVNADHAVQMAAGIRHAGMDFATLAGPQPALTIQWTAAFGKKYVWASVTGKDFDTFCRQVNIQAEACQRWGIRVALHNHMGTLVETEEQLEEFLVRCPASQLVFDTAHLAAMGGDAVGIAEKYADRLAVLHVKDWIMTRPDAVNWNERGRFCELGAGNIGLDNGAVVRAAVKGGFDGWIFVEHDSHRREPLEDLTISREYLRRAGY